MKIPDKDLIKSIKSGDKNKPLQYIYEQHYPEIYRILKNKGAEDDDIKDIFQDSIMILVKKIINNSYGDDLNIVGFLIKVGKNFWISKLRKDKRLIFNDINYDIIPNDEVSYFHLTEEKKAILTKLFDSIGERCEELIKLVYYSGYNMQEVSEALGYSGVDSAKAQHYKCKQRLIKKYKAKPYLKESLLE